MSGGVGDSGGHASVGDSGGSGGDDGVSGGGGGVDSVVGSDTSVFLDTRAVDASAVARRRN